MGNNLNKNIFFNYISQIYISLVGIAFVPILVSKMGAEAYGLIGFYSTLMTVFYLLDMGLTPTIGRETARLFSETIDSNIFFSLYKILQQFFYTVSICGAALLIVFAEKVANNWLTFENLPKEDVVFSLKIMGGTVALRWLGGFYRGIINGAERQVWQSSLNLIVATFRFVVVVFVLSLFGNDIKIFFIFQLLISLLETLVLYLKSRQLLSSYTKLKKEERIQWDKIKPLFKFSLMIAFTSGVWIVVTQLDKLILSGILSLSEYGYFSLAILVASGVFMLSSPISMAIMPRMASLYSQGRVDELNVLYRKSTQYVAVITGTACIVVTIVAHQLLFLWTGNSEIAEKATPILRLYVIGNGLLGFGAFPYYYQYAKGSLRYHLIGNLVLISVIIPAIVICASKWGAIGAGWVWLIVNALYFLFWVTFSHIKLKLTFFLSWIFQDIFAIVLPVFAFLMSISYFLTIETSNRLILFLIIAGYSLFGLLVAVLCSHYARTFILSITKKRLLGKS